MKKKMVAVLVFSLLFVGIASAAGLHGTFEGRQIIRVTTNGQELIPADVPAVNLNGRTMIPIYMLRELGLDVSWDGANETVKIITKEPVNTGLIREVPIDKLKFYAKAADHYQQLNVIARELRTQQAVMASTAILATTGIYQNSENTLDYIQASYQDAAKKLPEIEQLFKSHGFVSNYVEITELLDGSIDDLYSAHDALTKYKTYNKNQNYMDDFIYYLDKSNQKTIEALNITSNGYDLFINAIESFK